jgi:hypothetical protein
MVSLRAFSYNPDFSARTLFPDFSLTAGDRLLQSFMKKVANGGQKDLMQSRSESDPALDLGTCL